MASRLNPSGRHPVRRRRRGPDRLRHRQAIVPRAWCLFRDRLDQLRRGRAAVTLNWVELTQGPMALNNIPALTLGIGAIEVSFLRKPDFYFCARGRGRLLRHHRPAGQLACRPGHDRASGERNARHVGWHRCDALSGARHTGVGGDSRSAGALYAHYIRIVDPDIFLFIYTVTMVIMVITGGKDAGGPIVGGALIRLRPEPCAPWRSSPRCSGSSTAC